MRSLISLFVHGKFLYYLEETDGKLDIRREEYDDEIEAAGNMPCSHDVRLPTNQDELNYYNLTSLYGKYAFELCEINHGGRITYIRKPEYEADIFTLDNRFILHVQSYKEETKEDKVINAVFKEFDFQNKTPEDFFEYFNDKLEKAEINILEEFKPDFDFSLLDEANAKSDTEVHEVNEPAIEEKTEEPLVPYCE